MLQLSTLKFLKDLKKHNNKPWFEKHRKEYEAAKMDFENFIQTVIDKHGKYDKDLNGLVAKKCTFRINRDVRFSKDKSPYKINFGASTGKDGKTSGLAGYYFHLEPGKSFFGGGLWMPAGPALKKVRQEIDYSFDEFKKIVSSKKFKSQFGGLFTGDGIKLTKVPQGFEKDNPAGEFLKFKSWLALTDVSDDIITSKKLIPVTLTAFRVMQPLLAFLNRPLA